MARRTSEMLSGAASFARDSSVDGDDSARESWLCRSTVYASEVGDLDDISDTDECDWSQLHTPAPTVLVDSTRRMLSSQKDDTKASLGIFKGSTSRDTMSMACTPKEGKPKLPSIPGFSNSEALRKQLPQHARKQTPLSRSHNDFKDGVPSKKAGFGRPQYMTDEFTHPTDADANQRKWDLEEKLQDTKHRCAAGVNAVQVPSRDLRRKLPLLGSYAPSVAEDAENRRKWDLERKLQDFEWQFASVGMMDVEEQQRDTKRKLPLLNPLAPSMAEDAEDRRKWDLERKLQDAEQRCATIVTMDMEGQNLELRRKLSRLDSFAPAELRGNRQKWGLEIKLHDLDVWWFLRGSTVPGTEGLKQKLQHYRSQSGERQVLGEYQISAHLGYLLLFTSTAVLHSAIFNFSLELRQFLHLDTYPIGLLLLVSWVFVGLNNFIGGVVGDLVQDRVLLLHRTVVVWGIAVVAFHIAAFQLSPMVTSASLASGFLCAGVGHGFLSPNVIALGVQCNLPSFQTIPTPLFSDEEDSGDSSSSSEEDSATESEASYSSAESDLLSTNSDQQQQGNDLASHRFFSGCFAATLMGFSLVQGYYFLVVNVDGFMAKSSVDTFAAGGFHFMLFVSFLLMASLIFFCFQSWSFGQNSYTLRQSCLQMNEQSFERKLARLEGDSNLSADPLSEWSWKSLFYLCNRALVGYALLVFILMVLIGAGISLAVMLLMVQASFSLRLAAFLLVVFGWVLTMVATSRQLNPKMQKVLRKWRSSGLHPRQLFSALFAIAFFCVSGCVAFLRAQLYTTMVVQVCQTRLLIPGTSDQLFDPELLGITVGASSLLLLAICRIFTGGSPVPEASSPVSPTTKLILFDQEVPASPVSKPQTLCLSLQLLPSPASFTATTRMCFAMLLYLVSVFLSSVVELYRRNSGMAPSLLPRSCGAVHSDLTFLWTLPHMVLLGASDALFRVSLQEECHVLARCFLVPSVNPPLLSSCWAGTVQSVISLAEALGYVAALGFTAVLSEWLFRPEPIDMALLFLLLTAIVALTYALLNRIAARAKAYGHNGV